MNTPEPVADAPRDENGNPVETDAAVTGHPDPAVDTAAEGVTTEDAAEGEEHAEAPHEPIVHQVEREVTLVRGVRYGRIVVTLGIVGAIVAMMVSALMPVAPDANYTLGQAVGFMALIGGVIGLGVGGLLGVVLGFVAKRRTGSGVAIQTDVR
ncbi:hypothetical protein ACXR2W_01660 [Leucobacter sp. HY1908]